MNSEVVKNFKLEIRKEESKNKEQTTFEIYTFECRNCQKQIQKEESSRGARIIDPVRLEYDLSIHLMQCPFYKNKK